MRIALTLAALLPALGQAQEICARAQGMIAETSLVPAVQVHTDWEACVESKPTDQPFELHEFHSSHLAQEGAPVTVVSCKMRTAERINAVHGDDGSHTPPPVWRAAATRSPIPRSCRIAPGRDRHLSAPVQAPRLPRHGRE